MSCSAFRPVFGSLMWAVLLLSATGASAQPTKVTLAAPEPKTLKTGDEFSIKTTYYASPKGRESAPVILLHDKDGNRFIWQNGFAEVLQKEGFAVITVDLRHHGESRRDPPAAGVKPPPVKLVPADFDAMWKQDLPAVKKFLMSEHHDEKLNINKLAIVGPGMGATVAAAFAGADALMKPYADAAAIEARTPRGQDVRGLVLLSPDTKVPKLPISEPLKVLREPAVNTAYLICGSKLNSADKAGLDSVEKQLRTFPDVSKRVHREDYNTKLTSTEILGKFGLENHMLIFLKKYSMNAESQWRVRRSQVETGGL